MANDISAKADLLLSPPQASVTQSKTGPEARAVNVNPVQQAVVNPNEKIQAPQMSLVEKTQQVNQTADRLNEIAQKVERNLKFSVDDRTGDLVIQVIDEATDEVIRQIPEERVLAMRENINSLKGILFSAKI